MYLSLHQSKAFQQLPCPFAAVHSDLIQNPHNRSTKRFVQHRSTHLAHRLQFMESPFTQTVVAQASHRQTVRQHHQNHVSCLTQSAAQLTVAHAQFLFPVSVKCFRARPTISIGTDDPVDFPVRFVRDQYLLRFGVTRLVPKKNDTTFMVRFRHAHCYREIPLLLSVFVNDWFFDTFVNRRRERSGTHRLALKRNGSIRFEVADVTATFPSGVIQRVDVVQYFARTEITVEDERTQELFFLTPINQLNEQFRVIDKFFVGLFALILFLESSKIERIMFSVLINVIDEQIIVSDLVSLFGMVPKPTDVFDELSVVIDEYIVDGDGGERMIHDVALFAKPIDPPIVKFVFIPIDFGQKAIEAGLIAGADDFIGDTGNGFIVPDHETGEIIGEVIALALILEKVSELIESFFDDFRTFNDSGHDEPSLALGENLNTSTLTPF